METKWKSHEGAVLDRKNGFDIIECTRCEFSHCVPIPSPEELAKVYREEYYASEKPLYFKRMEEDLEWWNLSYADRYETFEAHLPLARRTLIDVGSGPGYFLALGKKRGWSVRGIEPSKQAAAYSRKLGVEIIEDFLTENNEQTIGRADVIHMSETLEHIPDPLSILRIVHRILQPGGLLCVVVPNDYNPFQNALRRANAFDSWWVASPHHVNYFTPRSLAGLVRRSGFEVITCEATFPIDIFLLLGENYVGNDEVGRACHEKRKRFELSLDRAGLNSLKRKMYEKFIELEIGREIVLFAQRLG